MADSVPVDSDSAVESSAAVLADDSGHYSFTSDDATLNDSAAPLRTVSLLGEQEQTLFLVRQDLRKSRSEVERLSKSEQWYKQELKSQKHNRLETLERLYAQERKFMQENQRLQQECMRLYAQCATLERQVQATPPPISTPEMHPSVSAYDDSFEAQQQQTRIQDQCRLIEVLRKQKKLLLADIQNLSLEHNDKMQRLQSVLADLELKNKHVTGKCNQLLGEKSVLEHSLETNAAALRSVSAEREQLRQIISELNTTLQTQEHLLALKEQEFLDLKHHYNEKLNRESDMDAVHSYSMAFHAEINAKTSEMAALKNSLHQLQNEVLVMSTLEAQNAMQHRQLEDLNSELEAQKIEHENLKSSATCKGRQLDKFAISMATLQLEKEEIAHKLQQAQTQLQNKEQELIGLHKQYAHMCAICESTKFSLELQQIEQGKLECLNAGNAHEIEQLRENLQKYADKCANLSDAMAAAEAKLDCQTQSAKNWQQQLDTKTHQLAQLQMQTASCSQSVATQTETTIALTNDELTPLKQRIEQLEQQYASVLSQKQQTIALLQKLVRQQDEKIKSTADSEADWKQLLEALQATQQMEEQMRAQLELKNVELDQLNQLFAQQNNELHELQLLSCAHERHEAVRSAELDQLKRTFQEGLAAQAKDAAKARELQSQLEMLLAIREPSATNEALQALQHMLENETGRKFKSVISWQLLIKLLRKQLREAKLCSSKNKELHGLRRQMVEIRDKHEQAQVRIKFLEENLATERARFAASDLGKSTATEPAHEVSNLIDDYKKLIQQTAKETGRPRNSYILELIERSQRSQPNLCQLAEGMSACRTDVVQLKQLLERPHREVMPSLMEELRAVTEQT